MPWRLSSFSAAAHFFHRGETLLTKVGPFFFNLPMEFANTCKPPFKKKKKKKKKLHVSHLAQALMKALFC